MVNIHSSISVCNYVDQSLNRIMSNSVNSSDLNPKPRHNTNLHKNRKSTNSQNCLKIPSCDRSRSAAAIDVLILIAVITASGFLFLPYIKFVSILLIEFSEEIVYLAIEEITRAPLIYGSIALSISCSAGAALGLLMSTTRKCGNPRCKGLRKAAEFDIQLETEEYVKNSSPTVKESGVKRGLFELFRDQHRELEAELKKMAPPNGRAVLIFRARCGCSVGRLEVPGIMKKQRKIKK